MITASLLDLLPGFAVNCAVIYLIARFVYRHSNAKNRDFGVTLLGFSALVYLVVSMLRSLELNSGMGFGLLALFATMNIRSVNLPVKEMTYLFIAITLAVFNSLFTNTTFTLVDRIAVNTVVFALLYIVELAWGAAYEPRRALTYEKIDMVKPERYGDLLAELRQRTGLAITRVEVVNTDYVRDTVDLLVFYQETALPQPGAYLGQEHQPARSATVAAQNLA
jgi:Domain of unknown function (DUF4956)